ncbi:MAG: sensor histidine kinase [Clostridiales bacterium]|jgi:two-component system sensor histidine kinase YesM|nr:sensor histidine kinase [Clostridiales bacterium]
MPKRGAMKLKSRFAFVFLLVILAPAMAAMMLFSRVANRLFIQGFDDNAIQALSQQASILSSVLQDLAIYSNMLAEDQFVQGSLSRTQYENIDYYYIKGSMAKLLAYFPYQLTDASLTLVSKNGFLYSTHPHSSLDASDILRSDWYETVEKSLSQYHWFAAEPPFKVSGASPAAYICLSRAVFSNVTGRVAGALLMAASPEQLLSYIGADEDMEGAIAVFDPYGNRMASSGGGSDWQSMLMPVMSSGSVSSAILDGERQRLYAMRSQFQGWLLVRSLPESAVGDSLRSIQAWQTVFTLLCALVFCLLAFRLLEDFLSPMQSLIHAMHQIEKGNMSAPLDLPPRSSPEFIELSRHFSTMLKNLEAQIHENEENQRKISLEERQKLEYKYNMLQSQVNPHFLFNTLNDIKWLCLLHKNPIGADAISVLGRLLEASIGKQPDLIPLREEAENLMAYIYLLRIRYGDRFSFDIEIPSSVSDMLIMRMTLQPLVENAVRHGLQPRRGGGLVEVRAHAEDGDLYIAVRDDGVGMSQEQADSLFHAQDPGSLSRIGLVGTHERLRHMFGREYGITITSGVNSGVRIIVRVPCQTAAD